MNEKQEIEYLYDKRFICDVCNREFTAKQRAMLRESVAEKFQSTLSQPIMVLKRLFPQNIFRYAV